LQNGEVRPKPAGLESRYADQFRDHSVVTAYGTRPPYPDALVEFVASLSHRGPVLDLGCGTGELARRVAPRVERVTAVDQSAAMLAAAITSPGGRSPNIRWLVGQVEDVPLAGSFELAVAAESFHWFAWDTVCERLVALVPSRQLLLVEGRYEMSTPWNTELWTLIGRHSTNRDFTPYDLVSELQASGCFSPPRQSRRRT
jgi:SAM-dependent methyltransferase